MPARALARSRSQRARARGFSFLALLILIAVVSVAAASAVQVGSLLQRRVAEQELLFVGGEFQRALATYAAASPPGALRGPKALEDLVRDPRSSILRRHLRRIYVDPMTGTTSWGLVRTPDGAITAIHSLSDDHPIKATGFEPGLRQLEGRATYSEWLFGAAIQR